MVFERCHENLSRLHLNIEKNSTYFIPYDNAKEAFMGNRNKSAYFCSLSGNDWKCKFFSSFDEIEEDLLYFDADVSLWGKATVPSTFQKEGFIEEKYIGNTHPFPIDVPFVPKENPTALFIKDIELEETEEKDYYAFFEGISSAFYLYVNGEFVGFNGITHSTTKFNITEHIKNGTNRIAIIVLSFCVGNYLDILNEFSFSGIFSDAYLLERPKYHIEDIDVTFSIAENFSSAEFKLQLKGGSNEDTFITFFDPEGIKIGTIIPNDNGEVNYIIESPFLWSAETPDLYTILIESQDEFIPLKIGLKKISFDDGLKINNREIPLKGATYHNFDYNLGYIINHDRLISDLMDMKRNNINCIKTAHPLEPRFYEICDRLGFYVINSLGVKVNDKTEFILNDMDFKGAFIEIITRAWSTEKNFCSVIGWDLGFDNSYENIREIEHYLPLLSEHLGILNENFPIWYHGENSLLTNYNDATPALKGLKEKYSPIKIEEIDKKSGEFKITNNYDFIYLSRLHGKYEIAKNGKIIENGNLDLLVAPPKSETNIKINYNLDADGIYTLRIFFLWESLSESLPYLYEISSKQFMIKKEPKFIGIPPSEDKTSFIESNSKIRIFGKRFDYEFSKIKGGFTTLIYRGTSLIKEPLIITNKFNSLEYYPREISVDEDKKGIRIDVEFSLAKMGEKAKYKGICSYFIDGDGNIKISAKPKNCENFEVYFKTASDNEFGNLEYFGFGPDIKDDSFGTLGDLGLYKTKLQNEFLSLSKFNYKESNRDAYWFAILNNNRSGMQICDFNGFEFSVASNSDDLRDANIEEIAKNFYPKIHFGAPIENSQFILKPFSREDNLFKLSLYK